MQKFLGCSRFLMIVGLAEALLGLPNVVAAGPDQATKDRCTAYAQRAVQQYQIMQGHPGCEKNLDPLAWKSDVDYHYNGCLLFPASMSKLAEQARDNHLQACGGLADSGASAPTATPGMSSGGTESAGAGGPSGVAPTQVPGSGTGVSSSKASSAGGFIGQCQMPVNVSWAINAAPSSGAGLVTQFDGHSLAYHSIAYSGAPGSAFGLPPKVLNGDYGDVPVVTALVQRPSFFAHNCTGYVGVVDGPWVARDGGGAAPRYIWVAARGYLKWNTLTPDALKLLTQESASATGTKPAPLPASNSKPKK